MIKILIGMFLGVILTIFVFALILIAHDPKPKRRDKHEGKT